MKKLGILFVVMTILELWAFQIHQSHPILKPKEFSPLIQAIQLAMVLGGVEAARWLLRKSPVARRQGPENEWNKLWLWLGAPGGMLLCSASLLGKLSVEMSAGPWLGLVIVVHVLCGAILWTVYSLWALPDVLTDPQSRGSDKALMLVGLLFHLAGLALCIKVYPAGAFLRKALTTPALLITSFFYFILYYIWICSLAWAVFFKLAERVRRS